MPGAPPAAVTDLRVTEARTATGTLPTTLTVTLRWTPPAAAVTTIRYSDTFITQNNWTSAVALTSTLPGDQDTYTASLPYAGDMVYFALKTQNAGGTWSDLSNNAFWPRQDIYLPLILRGGGL
jgi:hypothetical protein